jgi:hypothetical protein
VVADVPGGADARARSGARLGDAVRVGVSGFIEEIVTFLMVNGIWAMLVGGIVYAMLRYPIALLLAPAIVPLTCGLARVADDVARERVVSLRTFVSGVFDRFWLKLALGAVQVLVLLVAIADLVLAPAIGGVAAVASMVLAVYVAASSLAYGLVFWTLLVDPERRQTPVRQVARLALAVVLRRPGQVAFLFLFAILSASVIGYLVVPVLFLPSIALLTVAAYVLPVAEEIRGVR